ncbi:metal ABC transporter permease [Tessaracoccus lapidicaptus]|uniref:Metal ABC transporter permease n=2 Tax=Tessaracoccus lapidicaptus TaxID=1427523 RepID=A0A1C0ARS7_9ACTN|nr:MULTISPECIES: methionine ABC transporter permease [Tessaracoccus]AQX16265.1 metal ABC transporter permease [Tessaracoccus sp. T2.5-30]OCL37046.1 metal ABC transporter permease [Tessaracoccus lapidicaptus]VEP40854.1 Methionine import system permease protein MetP [Tessaracoccus lapidicaptus]
MILLDTWFNNPALQKAVLPAIWETLLMVGISSLATVAIGLPLGVVLYVTQKGALGENRWLNVVLSSIVVNITRSIPYAILMLALIPVTRWIVGTALGPIAASVSLAIAAIPFFARLVETALREVHPGKLDAAHAMGSTKMQSITKVLIPEAMPGLVAGVTTTVVTIIGYSAMAGLVGGGGLGRLAYNYGFQRYQPDVMVVTVILIVIMVQGVQWLGDTVSRRVDHR